ncbi:hypothetical protein AWZ03_007372 [Drosophila navojoa]|uniref:Secreted protein n=1 Tax=Drosophila navojoa TaxID=7232 RepID=A0A484BBX2_DRONA|nr:hypothetical protein AWZ03_007372 [Drosophila navojoa]
MRNFHMCFLSCVALTTILYIFHERPNWDHAASTQPDTDNNEMRHKKNTFHIVAVACGQRAQETKNGKIFLSRAPPNAYSYLLY